MSNSISKGKTYGLAIAVGLSMWPASTVHLEAQLKKPARPPRAKTETSVPIDPLGRENPRSAMMGFLKCLNRGDYADAALYLQEPATSGATLQQPLSQLRVLHRYFKGDIAHLSDEPNGTLEQGLPMGQVRAGTFQVGDTTSDVILVRVDDPAAGKIWLISQQTVESLAKLSEALEKEQPTLVARILPAALTGTEVLGMSLVNWLGWLLSIPISILLAWPLCFLLIAPRLLVCKVRKIPFQPVWDTAFGPPLRYIVAISINSLFVYLLLRPPLLYRVYYLRLMAGLLAGCLIWLLARITDRGFERALNRARTTRYRRGIDLNADPESLQGRAVDGCHCGRAGRGWIQYGNRIRWSRYRGTSHSVGGTKDT